MPAAAAITNRQPPGDLTKRCPCKDLMFN
jgi:hypothetical protein